MEAFFLDGTAGRLFCVYYPPERSSAAPRGVVVVPPFAEELNMARHTFGRLARALAASGTGVLLIDLYGTGDSEGDFREGRWSTWRDDILAGIGWLEARLGGLVDLLGLRLGGLLAMDVAIAAAGRVGRVVLWNPATNGRNHVTQFLRLRAFGGLAEGGEERESTRALVARLAAGESINVIGYELSPALAADLDPLRLLDLGKRWTGGVEWFEVVGSDSNGIPPGAQRVVDAWRETGIDVTARPVADTPFWAPQGIEPHWADRLVAATVESCP